MTIRGWAVPDLLLRSLFGLLWAVQWCATVVAVTVAGLVVARWIIELEWGWPTITIIARWGDAVVLGAFGLLGMIANTLYWAIPYTPAAENHHVPSPLPLGAGFFVAIALALCPLRDAWCFAPLPIVWDVATDHLRGRAYTERFEAMERNS